MDNNGEAFFENDFYVNGTLLSNRPEWSDKKEQGEEREENLKKEIVNITTLDFTKEKS